nr:putative reverse transcriptase domain-containing protein [Tanacetum cinerariifolium]
MGILTFIQNVLSVGLIIPRAGLVKCALIVTLQGIVICQLIGALQDSNIEMGNFSLNNHYATILFDSGADFSFISTDFTPLLNVKPSFVNPGYVIKVANGKKVEIDRIIHDCKLELGNSLFLIDLIPLGHGSFDVIMEMDWLSKHKAEIVCHEKVVRIPLESGEILHVHGERTPGIAKALRNVKVDEPKLSDIFVVWDFVEVFMKDLSGFPSQRQVKFHIDFFSWSDASCKVSISTSALRNARIV